MIEMLTMPILGESQDSGENLLGRLFAGSHDGQLIFVFFFPKKRQ